VNALPPAVLQAMQRASALLQASEFAQARTLLEQVLQSVPRFVEAHRLLGGALQALGDEAGAERALRTAAALEPRWVPALTSLGSYLIDHGRDAEAEPFLRSAIAVGRNSQHAVEILARLLNNGGRWQEALDLCASFASAQPDLDILTQHAVALSALGRHDEGIALHRRVVEAAPGNAIAEFNLAAALNGAGSHRDAETAVRSAIARGVDTPEAHFVHACSLCALSRFADAEQALLKTIDRRATFVEAQRELARLIWMRTGAVDAASEHLDAALRSHPDAMKLHMVKTDLLQGTGDAEAAYNWLIDHVPSHGATLGSRVSAARLALSFDPARARLHAEQALAIAPNHPEVRELFADVLLANGDPAQAERILSQLLATTPNDQRLLAVLTTAWRLLGDSRHAYYCDYARMARGWVLDTPRGWSDLSSYLHDLAASLHAVHSLNAHPWQQSLRHGSQLTLTDLVETGDEVLRAFPEAIDGPIRRHIEAIGPGNDSMPWSRAGSYRMQGIWSVRLRDRGYHVNHMHPEGRLSSACYIELPRSMTERGRPGQGETVGMANPTESDTEGWLKFGEPGIPTQPLLAPEYFIRPEPGLLALFPSYFWHGTVPFASEQKRLTIAFDLVPASR
jgi:tetratricopeptide (TPR) repeat protein